MDTTFLNLHMTGKVPVQHQGRMIWLDGDIPVSQLKAALGGSGLVVKATRDVIRITLPARAKN